MGTGPSMMAGTDGAFDSLTTLVSNKPVIGALAMALMTGTVGFIAGIGGIYPGSFVRAVFFAVVGFLVGVAIAASWRRGHHGSGK